MDDTAIEDRADLRALYDPAVELALKKQLDRLDRYARQFIARSPFLCISSSNAEGKADISPRGDPAGFVQVLDERTLVIPDRPGNNRLDTMGNIVDNPNVALIFFVPGIEDTLRVAGKAQIVKDETLLARCAINGRVPKAAITVTVEEVFFHCAKALKRSRLWDPATQVDRREMPSLARIILDQASESGTCTDEALVEHADRMVEENYRTALY